MLDTGYLYAKNKDRIFINTCLGCRGGCSYCYLPKMGYSNNLDNLKVKTVGEILNDIRESRFNIEKNTLITLGCFSECWDEKNKPQTIQIIKYFLKEGNQVQLSTKKEITLEEASQFKNLIKYSGQLVINVSSSSISEWQNIEKNTDRPDKRFRTFNISNKLDIPTVLYMKPVLQGITIKDIKLYKEVIKLYNIKDVVVGSIFKESKGIETVHFSDKNKLFYNEVSDEEIIRNELREICNVFTLSSQITRKYKEIQKER